MALIAIGGEVSIPRSFTFEELALLPEQQEEPSLLLGGRVIRAVRLAAALLRLGVKPWARFAVVEARDGYRANIPIDAVGDCLLVYAVGEQPLPVDLGGPLRLLTRGLGRCANVKDVATLSFTVEPATIEHACAHEREGAGRAAIGGSLS
jgi:DMSO/TMAO reductase YedYZ molybdopterin-dependent catalytic subunit